VEVNVKTDEGVTVVELSGDIDGSTAPVAQSTILPLASPGCHIVLDMSRVSYMSSAGLRMLLSTYRQIAAQKGYIVLVGLSPEIEDIMTVTGFLKFFTTRPTLAAGVAAVRQTGDGAAV
jgi:anti-sigma B factor antagonist